MAPQVSLDYPGKDGTTLRDHLLNISRQPKGWYDDRLNPPELPYELLYLWGWFWDVVGGMGDSGFWPTLDAWARRTGNDPDPWEAELMGQMHSEYQKAVAMKSREQ